MPNGVNISEGAEAKPALVSEEMLWVRGAEGVGAAEEGHRPGSKGLEAAAKGRQRSPRHSI